MKKKKELTIEEQAHRDRLRDMYCGVFVVTVLVWVCRFCFSGLVSLVVPSLNYYMGTALSLLAQALSVFLPFFVFQKLLREPMMPVFRERPCSEHPILRSVFGIVAVGGLTLGAMGLMKWLLLFLESHGIHSAVISPDLGTDWKQTLFYIILSSLLYSFVYEVSFRGIAARTMGEENHLCAVLVSGIAYALSDGDLYGIAVRFAIGFVLGAFYLRIRSLWFCMILQAASCVTVSLWWVYVGNSEFTVYTNFLILMGIVFGLGASFLLFFPRRTPHVQKTPDNVALRQVFFSFGIYLMVVLVAFNLLVFTFSTEPNPADPLLQPTPEEGVSPPLQFNRDEEYQDYYGTLDPDIRK